MLYIYQSTNLQYGTIVKSVRTVSICRAIVLNRQCSKIEQIISPKIFRDVLITLQAFAGVTVTRVIYWTKTSRQSYKVTVYITAGVDNRFINTN